MAHVQLPADAQGARHLTWTKNDAEFIPPAEFTVAPTAGQDDVYAATDGQTTWQVIVRWQPPAPTGVALAAGKGNATVSWQPVQAEQHITYYEVALDPSPAIAGLPRHV